jgi:hypothetical protein
VTVAATANPSSRLPCVLNNASNSGADRPGRSASDAVWVCVGQTHERSSDATMPTPPPGPQRTALGSAADRPPRAHG